MIKSETVSAVSRPDYGFCISDERLVLAYSVEKLVTEAAIVIAISAKRVS
jgi:hypothetical protein